MRGYLRRLFIKTSKSKRVCFCRSMLIVFISMCACAPFLASGRALCQSATQTVAVDVPPIIFNTVDKPRKIVAINPDGTGRKELTDGSFDAYMPMWSPDGKRIVFCSQAIGSSDSAVYMMDVNSGVSNKVRDLRNSECEKLDWSPDAGKILVSMKEKPNGAMPGYSDKVFILSADGNAYDFFAAGSFALWSCGGACVMFLSSNKVTALQLLTIQMDQSATTAFMGGIFLYPVAISPDGTNMLTVGWRIHVDKIEGVSGDRTTESGLFSVKSDGSGKLSNIKYEDEPTTQSIIYYCDKGCDWSEDGLRIVSHKFTNIEGHRIIIFDSQGAGETVLDKNGQYPDWRK